MLKNCIAWYIIIAWLVIALVLLFLLQSWKILVYSLTFGVAYLFLIFRFRRKIRDSFSGIGKYRFLLFVITAVAVSVLEEIYIYSLGNSIAFPDIRTDIFVVPLEWLVWFSTWFLVISRKYYYTEPEALLTAGITGILFEYSGKGFLVSEPLSILLFFPVTIVVYAALFVLPMQLIDFTGKNNSWLKYPAGIMIPYLLTIPVVIGLYITGIAH